MPDDGSLTLTTPTAVAPTVLPDRDLQKILVYLGALIMLLAFGAPFGGMIDIPVTFFLKNKLNLSAHEVAGFRLIAAVPLYLSCLFGFARDSWNPFGIKDRGFMMLFGSVSIVLFLIFACTPVTYATLLGAILLLTSSFLFISSAQAGLTSTIGQQHAASGQVSAVWNIAGSLAAGSALVAGGAVSEWLEPSNVEEAAHILFAGAAAVMALMVAYAAWRPKVVFDHVRAEPGAEAQPLASLGRLLRHRPIYPALLIWLLWNFAPGATTPLQFYLQNTLHATNAEWGQWDGIFTASFVPTFIVFGLLCRRFTLRTLLVWTTVLAVPQMVPLLFIHSVPGALVAAAAIGLMGGGATAAYLALLIRSCPEGLQGTTLMMSTGLYFVAARFGDVLGTHLYDHYGGFSACVVVITIVYALILPALLLVPARLTATADGETPASSAMLRDGRRVKRLERVQK